MRKIARLFAALNSVQVDASAGVIRNCAVMTAGPTIGHPFAIDCVTLKQVSDLINAAGGVKVRISHPAAEDGTLADDVGSVVGKLLAPVRLEGNQIRGDVEIGDYASHVPGQGDVRAYLLAIAQDHPEAIGLSVVMVWEPELIGGVVYARVSEVMACDFVGTPAANPNGLLAAIPEVRNRNTTGGMAPAGTNRGKAPRKNVMSDKLKAMLVALGCDPKSTDEQFQAFLDGLSDDQKSAVNALAADPQEPNEDDAEKKKSADAAMAAKGKAKNVAQLEANRQAGIHEVADLIAPLAKAAGKTTEFQAAKTASLVAGHTPEQSRTAMMKAIETPAVKQDTPTDVRVGEDQQRVAMCAAIPDSIRLRAGLKVEKAHELAPKFAGMTLVDQARHYLAMLGVPDVWSINRTALATLALNPRRMWEQYPRVAMLAQSTGDFTNLLRNAIDKQVLQDYRQAENKWPKFARKSFTNDFKPSYRTGLSDVPVPTARLEGKSIDYTVVGERGESLQVTEYIGGLRFTRMAMVNDDLNQLSRLPSLVSIPCKALEDIAAFNVLNTLTTANMADGSPIVSAGRGNLVATAKNAPDLASTREMIKLMAKQTAPKGMLLELEPKKVIVPADLAGDAVQFFGSSNLLVTQLGSTASKKVEGGTNPYAGRFEVITSARLTSATGWLMMADYAAGIDTIEVAFLRDEPEPVVRTETDFDTEDLKIAFRHAVTAKAVEYRGIVYNPGQ